MNAAFTRLVRGWYDMKAAFMPYEESLARRCGSNGRCLLGCANSPGHPNSVTDLTAACASLSTRSCTLVTAVFLLSR
jgi:hypothetical protein